MYITPIKNTLASVWEDGFAKGFIAGRKSRARRKKHGS